VPATKRSLKLNVFSNVAGTGWLALVQIAVVPIYLHLLGVEGYALIGFYFTLQGTLRVLDLGLTPTVNRKLAQYSVSPHLASEARDFVRTFEALYWAIGLLVALLVWSAAPTIAFRWLQSQGMQPSTVLSAIRCMGVLSAMQWPLSLYQGGLMGLERQAVLNVVRSAMMTLMAAAGVLALVIYKPSITIFFWSQIALTSVHIGVMRSVLWRSLPGASESARIAPGLFAGVHRFAAGMTGITVCSLIITQIDKILLSKMLSLEMFGFYTLASVVGNALSSMNAPVFNAMFPRLTTLVADGREDVVASLFRLASQFVAVVTVPAALVMSLFSLEILTMWTRNAETARHVAPLLSVYILGTALNSLMNLPYALQLANGWTRLSLLLNLWVAIAIVPVLVFATNSFGALGAATVWTATNLTLVCIAVPATHRRLFGNSGLYWFADLAIVVTVALAVVSSWRAISVEHSSSTIAVLFVVLGAGATASLAAVAALPNLRMWVVRYLTGRFDRLVRSSDCT
jgi:O-antigen/teichoic acid export membrane protein